MLIGSCFLQCVEYFYYAVAGILLSNKTLKRIWKIELMLYAVIATVCNAQIPNEGDITWSKYNNVHEWSAVSTAHRDTSGL